MGAEIVLCWWCESPLVGRNGFRWCVHCDDAHTPGGCQLCTTMRRDPRQAFGR